MNGTAFQKTSMSYGNLSSFVDSTFHRSAGNSLLYSPSKSKRIPSKNSYKHSFAIPIECGKRAMHLDDGLSLWTDPHCIKLRTNTNRRICCGGLPWDIYIHPNQGESNDEFAVSVFPVKSSSDDVLPENYKLSYTVSTSLSVKDAGDRHRDDDQKASQFDHRWTREIEDVVYDDSPGSDRQAIDWKHQMQRLPFSTADLLQHSEDGQFFDLNVCIQTTFIKSRRKRSLLFGVMGAIVVQSEDTLEDQQREIERLRTHRDEHTQSLQQQLQTANKLNAKLTDNMAEFAEFHKEYTCKMEAMQQELKGLGSRGRDDSMRKEREINRLQQQLADKQEEIQRVNQQMAKLKEQINTADGYQSLYALIQQQMQSQQMVAQSNQALLQQQNQQQRLQYAQQLAMQQTAARIQQEVQSHSNHQNHTLNLPNIQPQPQSTEPILAGHGGHNGHAQGQGQGQDHGASTGHYQAFPASPQPNISTTGNMPSGGTVLVGQSPQSVITNFTAASAGSTTAVGGSSAYQPRVISQPSFTSYQTLPVGDATSSKEESFNSLTQDVGAMNVNLNIPALEQSEQPRNEQNGQNEQEEMKRDSLKKEEVTQSAGDVLSQNQVVDQPVPTTTTTTTTTTTVQSGFVEQRNEVEEGMDEEVDAENDEEEFEHRPVRAHRFATDQGKWRGRGKGQVKVYWNKRRGLGKLIFIDEKHQKIRLKQWINGEEHCQHPPMDNAMDSNNSASTINSDEVEWFGTDYTMDDPMIGRWKFNFMDHRDAAEHFVRVFNDHIDGANGVSGDAVNDTVGLHVDEEENQEDDTKQFAFDHKAEAPVESSFTNTAASGFGDQFSASAWGSSFGGGGVAGNDEKENAAHSNQESNSFANIDWGLGGDNSSGAAQQPAATTSTAAKPAGGGNDEDNMAECTFKPIVQLEEQHVATGHENETMIAECEYAKLYRFGPDVSGDFGWKNRGSQSSVQFYKDNGDGSVRMISREHITNKLRMNQAVYPEDQASFTKKNKKMYSWTAFDATIAAEEEDVNKGQSAWLIKFATEERADEFAEHFRSAMRIMAGSTNPAQGDEERPSTPKVMEQPQVQSSWTLSNGQNEQKVDEEKDDEAERYKGWEQHEIDQDKARRAKAAKDAESALKFQSNDGDAPQTVSWSMDAFGGGDSNNDAAGNLFGNINFEDQRGVDLEAEAVLNKIKVDPTISFGVDSGNQHGDGQDFSNVTTRGDGDGAAESSAGGNAFGGLGANGFTFSTNSKEENPQKEEATSWSFTADDQTKEAAATTSWGDNGGGGDSWNIGGDSNDKNEADSGGSGWGDVGGGFSSVKTTEGFGNVSWGNGNADNSGGGNGGWGSFETNTDFNLESMATKEQPVDAIQSTQNGTTTAAVDDEDNMAECTFKPIVQLEEVEVAAGTEQDKKLDTFEVAKLYRWGKDVTGDANWKNRATNTSIDFWQQPNKGKVRVICRENVTQKLRLNHFLPASKLANVKLRGDKFVQWSGFDTTIHAEDEDDNNGFCMFNCKFRDAETAKAFHDLMVESIENNEKLVGK